ncbi:MAG TPA: YqgE/AlgH family protein [Candidatus Binatia bacterium]|nr:YqgE/AlgH family protein [Candidatus Binatia bacterium]
MTLARALCLGTLVLSVVTAEVWAETPPHRTLTGRLLVATDKMNDTRFERTVLYVVRHDAEGALGLVVNLPLGEVPFERALGPLGLEVPPGSGSVRVHWGGPVNERRGFVLHTPEWTGEGTVVVDAHFALTEDPRALQAMARGAGPKRALFCLGYAGWAPGQLDREMTTGAWGVAIADERLVFEMDPQQKWIEAMSRRLLDL